MRTAAIEFAVIAVFAATLLVGAMPDTPDEPPVLAIAAQRSGISQILIVDARGKIIAEPTYSGGAHSPSWSPDGKRIAFCSGPLPQILVMNADGTVVEKLTDTGTREQAPCWSPDGKKILFVSNRTGKQEIFVMNADGSDPKNLTNHPAFHAAPAWSPDGKQILFTARHDDGSMHVVVVNSDGQGLQQITDEAGWNVWPAWSPDGRYIAYVNYSGVPGQPGSEHGRLVIRDLIEDTPTPAALAELQCGARPAWKPKKRGASSVERRK